MPSLCCCCRDAWRLRPSRARRAPAWDMAGERRTARVLCVYDGDTLTAAVLLRGGALRRAKIRLAGIDAPEAREEGGAEATAYLKRLCDGRRVTLHFPAKGASDKYGRLLAVVTRGKLNVNDAMLAAGHAVPYAGGAKKEKGAAAVAAAAPPLQPLASQPSPPQRQRRRTSRGGSHSGSSRSSPQKTRAPPQPSPVTCMHALRSQRCQCSAAGGCATRRCGCVKAGVACTTFCHMPHACRNQSG